MNKRKFILITFAIIFFIIILVMTTIIIPRERIILQGGDETPPNGGYLNDFRSCIFYFDDYISNIFISAAKDVFGIDTPNFINSSYMLLLLQASVYIFKYFDLWRCRHQWIIKSKGVFKPINDFINNIHDSIFFM